MRSRFYLFVYLFGVYIAFNTVQVISRRVVGRAEETSTYSSSGFCAVNCRPMASNYQLSHLRSSQEPNPSLRGGRRECCHSATVASKAGLGQYDVDSLFERVHVDILRPFTHSISGNQYVLMIMDQFTKWLKYFPLPHQNAEKTVRCVVNGFISHFGCRVDIHTHQGKNFDKLFVSICDLLQITKTRTTPYRPCSNGQVECYNRTLLQLI